MFWARVRELPALIVGALIGGITLLIMVGVVGRYSGLFSFPWIEETVRGMFIWLIFLGGSVAAQRNAHFRLALLDTLVSPRLCPLLQAAAQISLIALGLCLFVFGSVLVRQVLGQSTTSLGVPLSTIYAAVPISGVLLAVFASGHLRASVAEYRSLR
jgi:TRAP-type C4-dicarboxylate transport system permease small subunit